MAATSARSRQSSGGVRSGVVWHLRPKTSRWAASASIASPRLRGGCPHASVNLSDRDFRLLIAWMAAALRPVGLYPIRALYDEHGKQLSASLFPSPVSVLGRSTANMANNCPRPCFRPCFRPRVPVSVPRPCFRPQVQATLDYAPLTTDVMLLAAKFWADARRAGLPTAPPDALDGNCILAAQAEWAGGSANPVTVATDNVTHLSRFIDAQLWETITS
jgi:hypothetical protein